MKRTEQEKVENKGRRKRIKEDTEEKKKKCGRQKDDK
jgi:hypothetical protein